MYNCTAPLYPRKGRLRSLHDDDDDDNQSKARLCQYVYVPGMSVCVLIRLARSITATRRDL